MYVIFRVDPQNEGGDVYALFPECPFGDNFCMSFQHVGGHSAADYQGCIERSRPAKPEEYADLLAELIRIGYDDLVVRERATREMHDRRNREAREER